LGFVDRESGKVQEEV
jgi:hypothetical protein